MGQIWPCHHISIIIINSKSIPLNSSWLFTAHSHLFYALVKWIERKNACEQMRWNPRIKFINPFRCVCIVSSIELVQAGQTAGLSSGTGVRSHNPCCVYVPTGILTYGTIPTHLTPFIIQIFWISSSSFQYYNCAEDDHVACVERMRGCWPAAVSCLLSLCSVISATCVSGHQTMKLKYFPSRIMSWIHLNNLATIDIWDNLHNIFLWLSQRNQYFYEKVLEARCDYVRLFCPCRLGWSGHPGPPPHNPRPTLPHRRAFKVG